MKCKVETVLVGRQTLFREALALLLSDANYKLIRSACWIDEFAQGPELKVGGGLFIVSLEAGAKTADRDAAFSDVQMLRQRYPDARLIILSNALDTKDVVAALRAGANGYMISTMTSDALIKSLDLVMCGETVVASEFMRAICEQGNRVSDQITPCATLDAAFGNKQIDQPGRVDRHPDAHKLSRREAETLSRLTQGDSNKLIARRVGISEATVKTHIKAILRKISVKNRTQAALWAVNNLPPTLDTMPQTDLASCG